MSASTEPSVEWLMQAIADVEACYKDVLSTARTIDEDKHWRNNLSVRLKHQELYLRALRAYAERLCAPSEPGEALQVLRERDRELLREIRVNFEDLPRNLEWRKQAMELLLRLENWQGEPK